MSSSPSVGNEPNTPATPPSEEGKAAKEPKEGDEIIIIPYIYVYRGGQWVLKEGQLYMDPITGKTYKVVADGKLEEYPPNQKEKLDVPEPLPVEDTPPSQ